MVYYADELHPRKRLKLWDRSEAKLVPGSMEDFNSETDSDYTSYWRDWVCYIFLSSRRVHFCVVLVVLLRCCVVVLFAMLYFRLSQNRYHPSMAPAGLDFTLWS